MNILVLGNSRRREFREVRALLEALGRVSDAADGRSAMGLVAREEATVDLIVIAQSYPGEFPHDAVDGLRRLSPLSRIVGLMGSWCEGEQRTGKPWPAVSRIYWHQWPARCARQLPRSSGGGSSSWDLPITAEAQSKCQE